MVETPIWQAWSQRSLKNGLEKNTLNLPDPTPLHGGNYPLPDVRRRDDTFPLMIP